jgi:hypothetical protein
VEIKTEQRGGLERRAAPKPNDTWRCHLASKNKTTIPHRAQDTITQQEMTELYISQSALAQRTATCQNREGSIAERFRGGAIVEPGNFFLTGTSAEKRP